MSHTGLRFETHSNVKGLYIVMYYQCFIRFKLLSDSYFNVVLEF